MPDIMFSVLDFDSWTIIYRDEVLIYDAHPLGISESMAQSIALTGARVQCAEIGGGAQSAAPASLQEASSIYGPLEWFIVPSPGRNKPTPKRATSQHAPPKLTPHDVLQEIVGTATIQSSNYQANAVMAQLPKGMAATKMTVVAYEQGRDIGYAIRQRGRTIADGVASPHAFVQTVRSRLSKLS